MKKTFSTAEIAKEANIASITARVWAKKNNIQFIGEGLRKTYIWTEEDLKKIKNHYSK